MKTIRSKEDAYEVATELIDSLPVGQTATWQTTTFTKVNADCVTIAGGETCGKSGMFYPCELADFVLYPQRKAFNDYIRSRLLPGTTPADAPMLAEERNLLAEATADYEYAQAEAFWGNRQ